MQLVAVTRQHEVRFRETAVPCASKNAIPVFDGTRTFPRPTVIVVVRMAFRPTNPVRSDSVQAGYARIVGRVRGGHGKLPTCSSLPALSSKLTRNLNRLPTSALASVYVDPVPATVLQSPPLLLHRSHSITYVLARMPSGSLMPIVLAVTTAVSIH